MTMSEQTIETPLTLRLTDRARIWLVQQAADSGQDISAIASGLIERAASRQSVAVSVAPVRKKIAGNKASERMSDEEFESFFRANLDADTDRNAQSAQASGGIIIGRQF
jgi:hypothetical protein